MRGVSEILENPEKGLSKSELETIKRSSIFGDISTTNIALSSIAVGLMGLTAIFLVRRRMLKLK